LKEERRGIHHLRESGEPQHAAPLFLILISKPRHPDEGGICLQTVKPRHPDEGGICLQIMKPRHPAEGGISDIHIKISAILLIFVIRRDKRIIKIMTI